MYLLAAMQHVSVVGCVDCIVVLGAVAGTVKVELCERVHVVSASRRLRALSCHDSLFCLAVNQPPVVIGDCRRLQVGACAGIPRPTRHVAVRLELSVSKGYHLRFYVRETPLEGLLGSPPRACC